MASKFGGFNFNRWRYKYAIRCRSKMDIGVSVGPFPEKIENVPSEFDFVELAIGEMEVSPEAVNKHELSEDLKKQGLDLVVHLPFRQPLATTVREFNKAVLDYFHRLLEEIRELKPRKAIVHCNLRYGQDKEEVREVLKQQLGELNQIGDEFGIDICFENIPKETNKPANLKEFGVILEKIDGKMCFDTGHAFWEVGQKGLETFLENRTHVISHLHLQDTRKGEDLHLPVDCGEIEWNGIGDILTNFEGTACIETFVEDEDYLKLSKRKIHHYF